MLVLPVEVLLSASCIHRKCDDGGGPTSLVIMIAE